MMTRLAELYAHRAALEAKQNSLHEELGLVGDRLVAVELELKDHGSSEPTDDQILLTCEAALKARWPHWKLNLTPMSVGCLLRATPESWMPEWMADEKTPILLYEGEP